MENKDSILGLCNAVLNTNKSYIDSVIRQHKINGRFTAIALAGLAYVAVTEYRLKKQNKQIDILNQELKDLKQPEGE